MTLLKKFKYILPLILFSIFLIIQKKTNLNIQNSNDATNEIIILLILIFSFKFIDFKNNSKNLFKINNFKLEKKSKLLLLIVISIFSICSMSILTTDQIPHSSYKPIITYASIFVITLILFKKDLVSIFKTFTSCFNLNDFLIISISSLSLLILYCINLNSWKYSFIGDEYAFYYAAENLIKDGNLFNYLSLSYKGVYNGFPRLTTSYQALIMLLLGENNFGWRASMALSTSLCFLPLYYSTKIFINNFFNNTKLISTLSTLLILTSEPVLTWATIGKPHALFLIPASYSVFFCSLYLKTSKNLYIFLTGAIAGIGLFFSPVGSVIGIASSSIRFLGEVVFSKKLSSKIHLIKNFILLLVLGFIIAGAPILVQKEYFVGIYKLNLNSAEYELSKSLFYKKTIQTFFSFFYFNANGHFLLGNIFNQITSFLVLIGFFSLFKLNKIIFLFSFTELLLLSIMIGGMSQYTYPPPSRIHLIIFPFLLVTSHGIGFLIDRKDNITKIIASCFIAFFSFSGYQHFTEFTPYKRDVDYRSLVLREVQSNKNTSIHLLTNKEDYLLDLLLRIYECKKPLKIHLSESKQLLQAKELVIVHPEFKISKRLNRKIKDESNFKLLERKAK